MQMLRIEHLKNKSTHSGGMGRHMSAGARENFAGVLVHHYLPVRYAAKCLIRVLCNGGNTGM
jgi:hypothetical protein